MAVIGSVPRILRAFAWMRWRVLVNSIDRTGSRDTMERLSIAADRLGPIVAVALLVPSLIGISALSAFAGYAIATRPVSPLAFEVLRYLLLVASGFAVAGPLLLPGMEAANVVRLLLLPIPRSTLYLSHAAGALGEPWTLLVLPIVLFLPAGLAAGAAWAPAVLSFAAGLLFLTVMVGLSTLTAGAAQLVARDRRRGEIVALGCILTLPLLWMLSAAPGGADRRRPRGGAESDGAARAPGPLAQVARSVFAIVPSEQHVTATRAAVQRRAVDSLTPLGVLALTTVVLHGAGLLTFLALLASPGSTGRRKSPSRRAARVTSIPGLSPAASAVCLAHVRLAIRTPRGRSTLLSPLVMFVVLAVMARRIGAGPDQFLPGSGLGLAMLGAFLSLLSVLPLAANQFAIDGAGLTLELLSPVTEEELLAGKAAANGLIAAAPAGVCVTAAYAVAGSGSPALWLSVPIGLAATYLLAAPVAALASILFPRVVDLNSIGRGSNAHGVAGLIAVAASFAAALPPVGLGFIATRWLGRPGLAPVLLLLWLMIGYAASRYLFVQLRALLIRRRENLASLSR